MEKLFIIGDIHFGLDVDKPMDVFGSQWENHTAKIAESWQSRITEDDITVVNGDLSWGINSQETRRDLALLDSFPGRKILVKGNHDLWWDTMAKVTRFFRSEDLSSLLPLYNSAFFLPKMNLLICGTRGWKVPENTDYGPSDAKVLRREMLRFEASVNYGLALARGKRGAAAETLDFGGESVIQSTPPEIIAVFHYPPFDYGTKHDAGWETLLARYGIKRCFFGHVHNAGSCKRNEAGEVLPVLQRDGVSYYLTAADFLGFEPMEIAPAAAPEALPQS